MACLKYKITFQRTAVYFYVDSIYYYISVSVYCIVFTKLYISDKLSLLLTYPFNPYHYYIPNTLKIFINVF